MASEREAALAVSADPPSPAARRRRLTRALFRNARAEDDPLRQLFHFQQEMAEQFAKNRLSSAYAIPFLVLMLWAAGAVFGDPIKATIWLVLMMASHAFALKACRRFLLQGVSKVGLPVWQGRFIRRDFYYGVSWAIFPLVFPVGDFPEMEAGLGVIRLAAVIVALSVGAMLSSPIPAAAVAGTLPIALCMAAAHIADPSFVNVTIALATLGAEILFLHLTSHLYDQHARNVAYRAEKDAIFGELEQSKAVSDEARRRAEAANMAKSQFLATMSHELRTPLNAIMGFSEIMRNELLGRIENDTYKDYLNDIHNSGQHLLGIINEILDLSRIEAGKRELKEELTSLVGIAEEAASLLDLKARQKMIRVVEIHDHAMPKIVVDEQAIRQVVLNLVSNALKFTPAGGKVTIKVGRTQSGGQYLSVRDNGPGIAEQEIPIVLSAFGQGSVSIKNAEQGAGLGIPIVQALVHLHDGNFTLRSQIGIGTEAIATFPAKRVVSAFAQDKRAWGALEARKPVRLRKSA